MPFSKLVHHFWFQHLKLNQMLEWWTNIQLWDGLLKGKKWWKSGFAESNQTSLFKVSEWLNEAKKCQRQTTWHPSSCPIDINRPISVNVSEEEGHKNQSLTPFIDLMIILLVTWSMTRHAVNGAALPWGHWRWRCFPFLFFSFLCMLISFFRSPTPTSMIFYSWDSNNGQILGSIHTLCIFYWYRATGEALKCLKLLLCLLARVWWMTCDRAFNEVFCQLAFNKDITHFVCVRCLDHRPTRMLLSTCMHTKACKLMQINAPRKILSFLFISFLRFFCYYRNIFTATVPKTFRMALIVQISHTVYSNCHLLFTHTACTLTAGM